MADGNQGDQQCSFGIKKIVDCKIDQTGKQLYKVKWEATWEPADSLSSCQHLIDEFWGFVNKAKTNEDIAQQHRKRMRLDPSAGQNGTVGLGPHHMLSEDSKDEVQRLIARTNATQPGSLMTPSDLLNTQQNQMGVPRTPTRAPQSPFAQNTRMPFSQSPGQFNQQQQQQQFGSPQTGFPNQSPMSSPSTRGKAPGFGKAASNIKSEQDESITTWSVSNLPPLSANQEEIAEICYVCKNCKKPLSKHKSTWRRHYSSCAQQFPYNCHVCGKGFTMKFRMEGHVAKVHGEEPLIKKEVMKKSRVKPEPGTTIKSEPIDYHYGDQRLDLEVDNQLRLPSLPDNVTTDNNKKTSERHHPNSDIKMESFEMVFGFR